MMNIKNHHPDSLNVPLEIIYNDPVLANNVMMDEKLVLNSSDLSNGHNNEIKDLEINGLASENENVERYQLKNLIDNVYFKDDDLENIETTDLFFQDIVDTIFLSNNVK